MIKALQLNFYFIGDDSSEDQLWNYGNKRFIIDPNNKELRKVIKVLMDHPHKKFLYTCESRKKNLNQAKFQITRILKWLCENLNIDAIENQSLFDDLIKVCTNYDIWSTLVRCIKNKIQDYAELEDFFDKGSDLYELMVNTPRNQMELTKLLTNIHKKKGV